MYLSLKNRIFIIFTILLTIPFFVLSIAIPTWFTSIIETQTIHSTNNMMHQYSHHFNTITLQAEEIAKQVLVSQTTQQWLKVEKENSVEAMSQRWAMKNELKGEFSSMVLNNSHGISIFAYLNDGTGVLGNYPSLKEADWFKAYTRNSQSWTTAHSDHLYSDVYKVNSFLFPLVEIDTLKKYGIIKINIPSTLLEKTLSEIRVGESGRVYLINKQGQNVLTGEIETPQKVLDTSLKEILYSDVDNGLMETNYNGKEYLVFYHKLTHDDWLLFSEITKDELFFNANQLKKPLLIMSGLILILTIITSYVLSTNIVRPIGKLTKIMKFIERGDFTGAKRLIPSIQSGTNEIKYLVKVVDHMIDRLNQLIKFEYLANIRRKDAEYKALLLQINPHFLNNTLEIMGGLAAQGKNKEVVNVSVYLGEMMRYSLSTQSSVVQLQEEINYIRNFTSILKIRYEDAIAIEIEEDPKTKSLSIIKFIIQPLVENAVKYSLIKDTRVAIKVKTEKRKNQLLIAVEDNGIGMPEDVISQLRSLDINNESNNVLTSKGTSIGLKNVIGRLRLYYSHNFVFHIESEKNKGTKITLCITTD